MYSVYRPDLLEQWLSKFKLKKMDLKLLQEALTHPSYKGLEPNAKDYERLEFLGDAVLDLVAAEELYHKLKKAHEGALTEKRKSWVNNEHLARIFDKLQLEPLILSAVRYQFSLKDKANIVEALFGAFFLHHGYKYCKNTWEKFQQLLGQPLKKRKYLDLNPNDINERNSFKKVYEQLGLKPKNAKSLLQELCQKQNLPIPEYKLIERIGPDHDPIFRVKVSGVFFHGPQRFTRSAIGEGRSKKIAEMRAAEKLCEQIYLDYVRTD